MSVQTTSLLSSSSTVIQSEDITNDYSIGRKLDEGGYGMIFQLSLRKEDSKMSGIEALVVKRIPHKNICSDKNKHHENLEVQVLGMLSHPNIIRLKQVYSDQDYFWLVFPQMPRNLQSFIHLYYDIRPDEIKSQTKRWMRQLLEAVSYCHRSGVIHRDIKPANILLDNDGNVVLADFGSAKLCPMNSEFKRTVDEHGSRSNTLHFAAPELLLNLSSYNHAVDIWSCACVFLQLLYCKQRSLFCESSDFQQLCAYFMAFGTPSFENSELSQHLYWPEIHQSRIFSFIKNMKTQKECESLFPLQDAAARDLLLKMFRLNPRCRISVEEALNHEYFQALRMGTFYSTSTEQISQKQETDFWKTWYDRTGHWDLGIWCEYPADDRTTKTILNNYRTTNGFCLPDREDIVWNPREFWKGYYKRTQDYSIGPKYERLKRKNKVDADWISFHKARSDRFLLDHELLGPWCRKYWLLPPKNTEKQNSNHTEQK